MSHAALPPDDPLGPRLGNGLAGPDAVVAMAANAAAGAAEASTTEAGAAAMGAGTGGVVDCAAVYYLRKVAPANGCFCT
jgi:hypothetical protein